MAKEIKPRVKKPTKKVLSEAYKEKDKNEDVVGMIIKPIKNLKAEPPTPVDGAISPRRRKYLRKKRAAVAAQLKKKYKNLK